MNNILYISYGDDLSNTYSGVTKKIKAQARAIESLGGKVFVAGVKGSDYGIMGEDEGVYIGNKYFFQKKKIIFKFLIKQIEEKKIDVLYIRMVYASQGLIQFLKTVKLKKIKILIEIPTYPYDNEAQNLRSKIIMMLDRFYRRYYIDLVDYIVTFSEDSVIFGVPCINISNAVDESVILDSIEIKEKTPIRFVSVSSLYDWHGVDRFIYSLENYYMNGGEVPIEFHIVGPDNNVCLDLKKIVNKSSFLAGKIFFLGYKNSKDLAEIYKNMHIGLGSLARHRSKVFTINTLKNKEYSAHGLPIIYSENDKDFDNKAFAFKVSADESIIDLLNIILWYKKHLWNDKEILTCAKKFTWKSQMKKVLTISKISVDGSNL